MKEDFMTVPEAEEQPIQEAPVTPETTPDVEAQKAEGEAPAKAEPTTVDVPKKFLKEDGSVDLEGMAKSYRELEKNFHKPEEAKNRKSLSDIMPIVSQPILSPEPVNPEDIYTNPEGVINSYVRKAVAPYEAKLKYNDMTEAMHKAKALPKFTEYESEVVEEIQKNPALNALFRIGEPSVFETAYGRVMSRKYQEIDRAAYERGRNEKISIQSSVPKVEGASAPSAPPTPTKVSQKERLKQLVKAGTRVDDIMVDEELLTPSERRVLGIK